MAKRTLPPLSGLRVFESFARTGSMTAAAAELGVTHGAISRGVRALQVHLGAQLVEGPRHKLRLTAAGQKLARGASAAFDLILEAMPARVTGEEIVLSCYGTLAMKWLIPRLPGFYKSRPTARIRIVEEYGPVDFGQGDIDAAIRLDNAIPTGARYVRFMPLYHGPVLSPRLWNECNFDSSAILHLPRLVSETFPRGWQEWSNGMAIDLPPAPNHLIFEHNSYMLEAAVAGLGVAIVPWSFSQADITAGRLIAPFGFKILPYHFALLRPSVGRHRGLDAFSRWLKREGDAAEAPPPGLI